MSRNYHVPPWDIRVSGMDSQSIGQAGVLAILRPFFPGEHTGKLMDRVGSEEFTRILKMMQHGLEDAQSVGALHERQNWLCPARKYVQDKGGCWQCRFCHRVLFDDPDNEDLREIDHHSKCFLMVGIDHRERGHRWGNAINVMPIPGLRRCSNSNAGVTTSKNVNAMECWECKTIADVLQHSSPRIGDYSALAEHNHPI